MASLFSFQTEDALSENNLDDKTCKVTVTTADGAFRYSGRVLSNSQTGMDVLLNAPDFETLSEYVTDIQILPEGAVSPLKVASYQRQEANDGDFDGSAAVNVSATRLESVIADMHWGNAFELGLGVDAMTNNLRPSAMKIELNKAQRPTIVQVNATKISTASEYRQALDLAVSGHYNTGNVDLKGAFSYMSDIKCSNTSLSIIVEYTVVESVYGADNTYEIKKEAAKYLGGQAFRERYGDYFIADVRRGARFTAVYTCTTDSEEKMTSFKTELSASGDLYGFSTSSGFTDAAKKNNVSTNIRLYYEGCKGSPKYKSTKDVMDVNKALEWFTENTSYVPLFAKLHHYSIYAPEVSNILLVAPRVFSRIWNLFDTINMHYCDAQNCPGNYTAEIMRNARRYARK